MLGIFDSGIGGLTVVKELRAQLPGHGFAYFGDTARAPYGPKGPDAIRRFSSENAAFLRARGANAIMIACNTASALATDSLRAVSPVPVFDVVAPAVRHALSVTKGRIGVIGTRATVASGVYERAIAAIAPEVRVHTQACPLFVPLVEEGWHETAEAASIARTYLHPLLLGGIDTLILGCTHYPFLARTIQRIAGPEVALIDPARQTVAEFKVWLASHPAEAATFVDGDESYFVSDASGAFADIARSWLGTGITLQEVALPETPVMTSRA